MYSTNNPKPELNSTIPVAKNKCYELLYMPAKNRVYLSIYGFWKSKSIVSEYLPDLQKVLHLVKPGFTLLVDTRTMITHPQPVMKLHIEAQMLLQDAGMAKGACVDPTDRIATLQVEDTLGASHLSLTRFNSFAEAESWLEQ
ncbi:hypothetical protein [uncultured Pontibacter sp.]|uniref:hypothetical protein n=1 Tax=uncultured Pontibacter sp. TaxID=453356 RepID=UPI002607CEBC|nr:hypothetical protein [uncultured Pontibacter sp.]